MTAPAHDKEPVRQINLVLGLAWKLALIGGLLFAASLVGNWVMSQLTLHLTPSTEPILHRIVMTAMAVYILLMMLPFVPGVEIGFGLIAMFGTKIVPLVYGGTVLALSLAFLLGRLVPQHAIVEAFESVRIRRAAGLLRQLEPLDSDERMTLLLKNASTRIVPFLLRHRFLTLVVALNVPGNAIVGGGGGICLVAGFSRLFAFPNFVIAVAVAVLPVPLITLLMAN